MPWPSAPERDRRLAGETPPAARSSGAPDSSAEGGYRGDEVERGPDGALGVVLLRDRRAPDRHHRVADELLDRAAVALDDAPGRVEVAGEQLADVLGVAPLGERREADEVGEQDGDEPALGGRRRGGRPEPAADARRRQRRRRTRRRTSLPAVFGAAAGAQASGERAPHSPQNFRRASFSVPQLGQVIRPAPRSAGGRLRAARARRRLEPIEDLACLGEKRLGLVGAPLTIDQPLAVLEQVTAR